MNMIIECYVIKALVLFSTQLIRPPNYSGIDRSDKNIHNGYSYPTTSHLLFNKIWRTPWYYTMFT